MGFDIFLTEKLLEFFNFNESGYVYYIGALVIYLVILNLAVIVYSFVDMRRRGFHIVFAFLISIFILVLNIPAFIIYLILRPHKTKEEREWEDLERKFISQEVEESRQCYDCKSMINGEHVYCHKCGTQNRAICRCGKMIEMDWEHCAYCGEKSPHYRPSTVQHKKKGILHKEFKVGFLENLNNRLIRRLRQIYGNSPKDFVTNLPKNIVIIGKEIYMDIKNLAKFTVYHVRRLYLYVSKLLNSSYNKSKSGLSSIKARRSR